MPAAKESDSGSSTPAHRSKRANATTLLSGSGFDMVPEESADDELDDGHEKKQSLTSQSGSKSGSGKGALPSAPRHLKPPHSGGSTDASTAMKPERMINFAYDEEVTKYSTMRVEFKLKN